MKITVDISSIEKGIPEYQRSILDNISDIIEAIGWEVVAYAQQIVPVDRGDLSAGIKCEMTDPLSFRVSDSVDYGIYWEFGTIKHWLPFVDRNGDLTDLGRWAIRQMGLTEEEVREMRGIQVQAKETRFLRGGLEHAVNELDNIIKDVVGE
jgi:hypothetical protein